MTLFAFAGNCGLFGASGFRYLLNPSAATCCVARKPSSPSIAASAMEMKPPPPCQRNSRRVRPQNSPLRFGSGGLLILGSVQVDEFVQVQGYKAEVAERLRAAQMLLRLHAVDEADAARDLARPRL